MVGLANLLSDLTRLLDKISLEIASLSADNYRLKLSHLIHILHTESDWTSRN